MALIRVVVSVVRIEDDGKTRDVLAHIKATSEIADSEECPTDRSDVADAVFRSLRSCWFKLVDKFGSELKL